MLFANAFLDFFQEHRALNALAALKQRLASQAIVRRGGPSGPSPRASWFRVT